MEKNKSTIIEKVYPFTNENLTSYKYLYNFNNARVLSVIGSGDQYFSSLLFGAGEVDLFDVNSGTIFYFILKFYGIKHLSYEDFKTFFVDSKLDNLEIYEKFRDSLPREVRQFFDNIIGVGRNLSSLILPVVLNTDRVNYSSGRAVPYFDKREYYKLQGILSRIKLPNIYPVSLEKLYKNLSGEYDIMLFSNIYMYLMMNENEFRKFLESMYFPHLSPGGVIQANYTWSYLEAMDNFEREGFSCSIIPSIRANSDYNDYVLSLRK